MDFPDDMTVNPTVDRQRILLSMRKELGFDAERGTDGASVLIKLWASLRDRHLTLLPDPPYPGVEPALLPADLGIVCGPDDTFSIAVRTAKERLEASKRSIDIYKRIMRPQHRRDLEAAARNWRLAEQAIDEEAQRLFVPFATYFEEPATISRKSLLATPRREGKPTSQVPLLNSLLASRPDLLRVQDLEDEATQEPAKPLDEIFSLKLKIPAESAAAVRNLMIKSRKALQWRSLHDGPLIDLQPAGEDDCPTPLSPPLLSRARNKSGLSTSQEQGVANAIGDLLYEPFTQHMQLEAPRIPDDPQIIEKGSKLEDVHAFLDFNLEQPEDSKALLHFEMRPSPRAPSPIRLPTDLFEACEDLPLTRVHLSKEPAAASASVAALVSSLSAAQLAPLNLDDSKLRKLSVPWGDAPRTKSGYLDLKEKLENTGTSLHLEPPRLPLPRPRAAAEQDDGVPTSLRQIVGFPRGSARSRAFSREDVPLRPLPGLRSLNIDLGDRWLRTAEGQQRGFPHTAAEPWQLGDDGSDTLDTTTAAEAMLNDVQEPQSVHPHAIAAVCEPLRFTSTPIGLVDEELLPAARRHPNYQVTQPPEVEEQPVDTIAEEPNAEEDESDGFKTAAASPSGAAGQQHDENGEEDELFDWQHWENDATSSSGAAAPAAAPAPPPLNHEAHHIPTSRTVARLTAAAQALDEERQRAQEQQRPWEIRRTPPAIDTIFGQKLFEDDAEQLIMEMSVQDQIHSSESGSSPAMRGAENEFQRESDVTTRRRVQEDKEEGEEEGDLERAIKRARLDANVAAARMQNQSNTTTTAPSLNPMDIFMSSRGMARAAAPSRQGHQQPLPAQAARRASAAPQPRAAQEAQAHNEDGHASPVFQPPTLTAPLPASRYLVTVRGLQHHSVISALQAPLLSIELVEVAADDGASSTTGDETLLPHLVLPATTDDEGDVFTAPRPPTPSRFVLLFKLTMLPSAMQANSSRVPADLDLRRTLISLLRSSHHRRGGLVVLEAWNSDSGNPLPASLLSMETQDAPMAKARRVLDDFLATNRWKGLVDVKLARSAEEAAWRVREYADGQGG